MISGSSTSDRFNFYDLRVQSGSIAMKCSVIRDISCALFVPCHENDINYESICMWLFSHLARDLAKSKGANLFLFLNAVCSLALVGTFRLFVQNRLRPVSFDWM